MPDFTQPLAAVLAYLRAEGLTKGQIQEIIEVHAVEQVPVESQLAFIEGVLHA